MKTTKWKERRKGFQYLKKQQYFIAQHRRHLYHRIPIKPPTTSPPLVHHSSKQATSLTPHMIRKPKDPPTQSKPLKVQTHMAHFLVVSTPLHGHMNPTLEFARRLARAGARVTFLSTVSAYRRMGESPPLEGLSYASFSDGYDDGFNYHINNDTAKPTMKSAEEYGAQFRQAGARKVSELVRTFSDEGCHVTCLVYSILQTWAADLVRELQIPSVALWIQPAAVLAVYYHYFHGWDHLINKVEIDPEFLVELPKLPPLASKDVPSFLLPSDPHSDIREIFRVQFETIDKELKEGKPKPRLLVNTFDALERDAIGSVDQLDLICIGPLIPAQPKKAPSGSDYMEWLDSKPVSSVIYISFGTIISPCTRQMEEILNGLLETRRPFLWVIRGSDTGSDSEIRSRVDECGEGLVVPWCSQVEVLAHPSTGCFVTHCGWNSTSESLAMGVPMVCFPQWTDQTTNAKLVEDVWKTGVRVKLNEDGVLEGGELKRCLEEVMEGEEIRKNAMKWRDLTREAVEDGGSSDRNMRAFVEEMREIELARCETLEDEDKKYYPSSHGNDRLLTGSLKLDFAVTPVTHLKHFQDKEPPAISSTKALRFLSEEPPSPIASLAKSLHFSAFFFISSPPITSSKHLFSSPPSMIPSSFTLTLTPIFQTPSTSFAFVV
ncbi:crocetin glucosyltransferase, chloroplastic-like protein [Cinnamomum micranthum f. kanehirae]|uniref:Crocetin glucosyltransferase, chloroplastic-like protein n=1 Tax=Cinnamomum micranthum f. kanehirae TaxID=337451 RepID=A0A3S3MP30_9MAGN|nr:crocetin glucosyltransferase, chloroplastic-like protein [Cinnamomum micranthum f. kanehirae]